MRIRPAIFTVFFAFSITQASQLDQRADPTTKTGDRFAFLKSGGFPPDPEKAAWRRITKICFFENQLLILDGSQNTVFVYDLNGELLGTIGRPGQGPGEFEKPSDMVVNRDGRVLILNAFGRSVSQFGADGRFLDQISLEFPSLSTLTFASSLCLVSPSGIIVAYVLSPHILDLYDGRGRFVKTLLTREGEIRTPGENLGNCSSLTPIGETILLLDQFTGAFRELDSSGKVIRAFSAFSQEHKSATALLKKGVEEKNKREPGGIGVLTDLLWSRSCVDREGNIFCFSLIRQEENKQWLYIFSREGRFLGRTFIADLEGTRIVDQYQFGERFYLVTEDQELLIMERRRK